MATSVDLDKQKACRTIEQQLKNMIFKDMSSVAPPGKINLKPHFNQSAASDDKRCFVSSIEKREQVPLKASLDRTLPVNESPSETGASELIDLSVLTNFAQKHSPRMDINITRTSVPHPDHEDDSRMQLKNGEKNRGISEWLGNIEKELQNYTGFCNVAENPPHEVQHISDEPSPLSCSTDKGMGSSESKQKNAANSRNSKRNRNAARKATKDKKVRERMQGLYVQKDLVKNLEDLQTSEDPRENDATKSPKQNIKPGDKLVEKRLTDQENDQQYVIKMKKGAFSSIGKEYSLFMNEGHYKLTCHICNYNNDYRDMMMKHLLSKNHRTLKEQNDLDMMLPFLPEPVTQQTKAITDFLLKIVSLHGVTKKDKEAQEDLCAKLKEFVSTNLPGCTAELVGSAAIQCGLKGSEVDFVLKVPPDQNIPDNLEDLYNLMTSDKNYINVTSEFKRKRPCIKFVDQKASLASNILIENGSSMKTAALLSVYHELDDRVRPLHIAIRYWAKICEIDQQDYGTLPAFCYGFFVVHFLQQVQPPVLPVIHEEKDYNGTTEYYEAYLKKNTWKSQNTDSLGELWLKFFQYYNFEYKIGENVVCIRSSKRASCKERNWSTKFYAVEDPFLRRNLAYVIPTFQVCRYIQQCFIRTYRYFAYPQLKDGSIKLMKTTSFDALKLSEYGPNKSILKEDDLDESEESENEDSDALIDNRDLEDHDPDIPIQDFISTVNNLTLTDDDLDNPPKTSAETTQPDDVLPTSENLPSPKKQVEKPVKENHSKVSAKAIAQPICYWDVKGKEITKEMFKYEFRPVIFKGEKSVPLTCKLCKSNGHQKKDCPNDDLPIPCPLPKMTSDFSSVISKVLICIKDKNIVSKEELAKIHADMLEVQGHIREVFPDATLRLFGSFCNGFGFKNKSDMDFCLTFGDRDDGKDLDSTEVIEKIAKELSQHSELENILSITSAKVPIVKFSWRKNGLEGDISLYNTLALVNTDMLEAYSKIDQRVQILGYALKYFAKTLGICDASRGSLSSYAYILMVLFFLQQRDPPVIPVLQELYDKEKPSVMIEGFNVWYYKDINKLEEIWPDYGKNKESVGELWVGLLNFYTCQFDWKENVISIKQKKPLTRFRKLWVTNQLAIEDPFDLNHNLGGGLSRKMNTYILKTFFRARERFGKPCSEKLRPNNEIAYLFNRSFLNNNIEPPQDRGCSNCGKIGHIARNCPQEKTCSYCRRPGHLMKNCPRNGRGKKSREREQNNSYEASNQDRRDSHERRNSRGSNQKMKNDFMRTYPGMQPQPMDMLEGQKLVQLGVPTHRMPPPGFQARNIPNPPPGFKPNGPLSSSYPPPFGINHNLVTPPFPRGVKNNDIHSQSPPKHYSSSPPKSFPGSKAPFHPGLDTSWPTGSRPGFQVERHLVPQVSRNSQVERHSGFMGPRSMQVERHPVPLGPRNTHPMWQNPPLPIGRDPHLMHPKSNQSHNPDHRLHRTNSDNGSYNSNHPDRW